MNNFAQPQFMFPYGISMPKDNGDYIYDILKKQIDKKIIIFINMDAISKVFKGILLSVGTDYLFLKDPTNDAKHLILLKNITYITIESKEE